MVVTFMFDEPILEFDLQDVPIPRVGETLDFYDFPFKDAQPDRFGGYAWRVNEVQYDMKISESGPGLMQSVTVSLVRDWRLEDRVWDEILRKNQSNNTP